MQYAKYKTAVAVLACGLVLGFGMNQFGPRPASAQDQRPAGGARPAVKAPDIEPIDPNLVFEPQVQKDLRLSENQVRRLTEARDKGTQAAGDQNKRVADIDRRIQELQAEIERLDQERGNAQRAVHKSQTDQVRAAIPEVLSREATQRLREMTLQRMRLSDVLLDAKVRARLDLNDEQVKRIQELGEKGVGARYTLARTTVLDKVGYERFEPVKVMFLYDGIEPNRAELLKVLTPAQRAALERLSGMKLDGK
jgi:uncharacterized small protein (DUF1192 family)